MSTPEEAYEEVHVEVRSRAAELAKSRCSKLVCGFADVVLTPSSPLRKSEGGMWFYDEYIHGVICQFEGKQCHFGEKPRDTTRVFADAMQQAQEELGLVGIVISPDTKGKPQDN